MTDKPQPLPWSFASDPDALKPKHYVVRDFLYMGEVAILVAPPATGKSAIAAWMALCVRNGSDFFGKRTKPGAVLFLAGERESDTRWRTCAMRDCGADIAIMGLSTAGRLDLRDDNMVARLLATVGHVEAVTGEPLHLLIVDTLARCAPGMEENSAKEVGMLVDALARIATETEASVLLLHHPAKNGKGLRGSSALDGAADRVLSLEAKSGCSR